MGSFGRRKQLNQDVLLGKIRPLSKCTAEEEFTHLGLYVTVSKPFPMHHCQALQYLTDDMARVILR
jgi:hypothetical protein